MTVWLTLVSAWLKVWNYDPSHLLALGIMGAVLGQLAMYMPNGPTKDIVLRILHGVFPSWQVAVNGSIKKNNPLFVSAIESLTPLESSKTPANENDEKKV